MAFINDEVPTGLINSSNKVFTLLNTPSQMVSVEMDGANYVNYVLVGNILTLTDAPTTSVYVDYFTWAIPVPVTSSVTFWDIKAKVWNLLGQTSRSTTFSDTIVWGKINNVIRELCKWRYVALWGSYRWRLQAWQEYRCWKLWFLEGKFMVKVYNNPRLSQIYNVGDTTLTISDTSNMLSAWYVQIWGDIFSYTSKSSTQLLWVVGGTIEHLETEPVIQLFETPLEMSKPNSVSGISRDTNSQEIEIDEDEDETFTTYWKLERTGNKQLIKIVWVVTWSLVRIEYTKMVTNLSENADICVLPEDYWITVVAYLVAGELWSEKMMPMSSTHLAMWCAKLQVMFGDFSNTKTITKQKLRATSYSNIQR